MVNKKGWLRIVEATIAILIIIGAVVFIALSNRPSIKEDYDTLPDSILDELAKNKSLKDKIIGNLSGAQGNVSAFVASRVNTMQINFSVQICPPSSECALSSIPSNLEGDLYASERYIGANLTDFNIKKVRLYIWQYG